MLFRSGVEGLVVEDGVVQVGPDMMTGHPGIFAGGDMVPDERSVTVAVGHGKKAARHIDAWLRGTEYRPAPKHPIVSFEMLHLPVYSDAERSAQSRLPVEERMRSFTEVQAGLGAKEATYEAKRCLYKFRRCYSARVHWNGIYPTGNA